MILKSKYGNSSARVLERDLPEIKIAWRGSIWKGLSGETETYRRTIGHKRGQYRSYESERKVVNYQRSSDFKKF